MANTIGSGHKVLERWSVRKDAREPLPAVDYVWTIHKDEAMAQIQALPYQIFFQGAGPLGIVAATATNAQKGNAATLTASYAAVLPTASFANEPRAIGDPPLYSEHGGEEEVNITAVAPYKNLTQAELVYATAKLAGNEDDVPLPPEPASDSYVELIGLIERGVTTKTMQRRTWVEVSIRDTPLGGADFQRVGKIHRPTGNPYTRAGHNWRQQTPSAEQVVGVDQRGEPVMLWRITRSWEESDYGGWQRIMYG